MKKQNFKEVVNMEKRNLFSIAGYHLFASSLGIFAILSAVFSFTKDKTAGNIFKYTMLGVIVLLILSLFLATRFYKNSNLIKANKKDIFVNKVLTYSYLVPLLAWIILTMLGKKALSKNLAVLPYQIGLYVSGALLFSLAIALFIYDAVICVKKDTKTSYQDYLKEQQEKEEKLSKEGELMTDVTAEENSDKKETEDKPEEKSETKEEQQK